MNYLMYLHQIIIMIMKMYLLNMSNRTLIGILQKFTDVGYLVTMER